MTAPPLSLAEEEHICGLRIDALAAAYRDGSLTAITVCEAMLARIARLDLHLHSFTSLCLERARREARAADAAFAAGVDLGPLQGIPYSVKDCIRAEGTVTTAASRVLAEAAPDTKDAWVVQRLTAAGAVLLGKNNLYEFVYAEPGEDDLFPEVGNPRGLGRRAGGSSSGSAAAVAAGLGTFSIGTDTGGSVRHPANLCGVVGYVGASGALSNEGIIPVSAQLDRAGVLARSTQDVWRVITALTADQPADAVGDASADTPRIAIGQNAIYGLGSADAQRAYSGLPEVLSGLGLACAGIEVPFGEEANATADLLMGVDALHYHDLYRDRAHLYGKNFVARIAPSRQVSALDYLRAAKTRKAMTAAWDALFQDIDILILPGNMTGAPLSTTYEIEVNGQPVPVRTVTSAATRASSLTGYPTLVLPVAESDEGLPLGVQLIAAPGRERMLFALAARIEKATGNVIAKWGIDIRQA